MAPQLLKDQPPRSCFKVGPWNVEPAAGEIRDGDRIVRLRPKAMELLVVLAVNAGEVLATPDLLDSVWTDVVVSHASLSVLVAEVRRALGDDPKSPQFIETIPRKGYRLIAPVSADGSVRRPTRFALVSPETRVLLLEGSNIIGRDPQAQIWIDSLAVSRRHSRLVIAGERATIDDLGSKNGTFLNGNKVVKAELLTPGDRITFGRMAASYRFVIAGEEETVTEDSQLGSPGS
jgi:DNA-binding winged helix-turn-helix (wHTH) protein